MRERRGGRSARPSKAVERQIIEALAAGATATDVAERFAISNDTVRRIEERCLPSAAPVELPGLDDKRFSSREMTRRIACIRDRCTILADEALSRLAREAPGSRPMVATATTIGILTDKVRQCDAYFRLMDALPKGVPESVEARQEKYQLLLWTLASVGGGSVPAARALGAAWGIAESAGRQNVRFVFEDGDGGLGDDTATAAAPAPARPPRK